MNGYGFDFTTASLGLLAARVVIGLVMAGHGAQKLFGWFGGFGLAGTGGYFEQLGFRPGRVFATAAGLSEFLSGLLIALGFLGPVGPALMISVMIVAAATVHWSNGLWAHKGGYELTLIYSIAGVAISLIGYGGYSLDALLGVTRSWTPAFTLLVLGAGIAGGFGNLIVRRPPAPAAKGV